MQAMSAVWLPCVWRTSMWEQRTTAGRLCPCFDTAWPMFFAVASHACSQLLCASRLGAPPPFAAMADKATVRKRTGQMHGIILMVEGVLVALFMSVASAPDPSGAGLATLLEAMLMGGLPLSLSIELLRTSLTCGAFDGQYQGSHEGHAAGLDVLSHFCQKLKLNPKFLLSRWDKAHLIELSMDEARKQTRWSNL